MRRGVGRLLALVAVTAPLASADPGVFLIEVNVRGADPGEGQVLVSLFASRESYLADPLREVNAAVDSDGNAFATLGSHDPGDYAVVVVYDKNGNGKLDTGLFRIPKEKIGFSNNARGKLGPVKWDDARFRLADDDARIEIHLAKAK